MLKPLTAEDAKTAAIEERDWAKLVRVLGEVNETTQSHEGTLKRRQRGLEVDWPPCIIAQVSDGVGYQ